MSTHDTPEHGVPGPLAGGHSPTATTLAEALRRAAATPDLEIDLAGVEILDARSLGLLLAAANTAHARGGHLRTVGAAPDVQRVLRALGLDRHLGSSPR